MTEINAADLAGLRAIAESGRNRPLLGGRWLVVFGAAIALASGLHFLILARIFAVPTIAIALLWPVAMVGAALLSRTGAKALTSEALVHRVERETWRTLGRYLWTMSAALFALVGWRLYSGEGPETWILFSIMPPITFGAYAIAMSASAAVADDAGLRRASLLALAFAAATGAAIGHPVQFALMALGTFLTSVLPGLALQRQQNKGS
jgi:hypothetical protein